MMSKTVSSCMDFLIQIQIIQDLMTARKSNQPAQLADVAQYQFTLTVRNCRVRLPFPCTFSLSWQIGDEVVESADRLQPVNYHVHFNTALQLKGIIVSGQNQYSKLRKNLSTLNVNYYSKSRPNESKKLAGFLTINLSEFVEGTKGIKEQPLERCRDKDSFVQFEVSSRLIRVLTNAEIDESLSFLKGMASPQGQSRSPSTDVKEPPVQPFPEETQRLSETVEKITERFFERSARTLKTSQNTQATQVTPAKKAKEELNQWADEARKSLSTQKKKDNNDQSKKQIPKMIAKLKSQKQITLESSLEQVTKQNQALKAQVQSLTQQVNTLTNKIKTLDSSPPKRGAPSQLIKLRQSLEQEVTKNNQLQEQLKSLTSSYQTQIWNSGQLRKNYEERQRSLEQQLRASKQSLLSLTQKHNQLQQSLCSTQQSLTQTTSQLSSVQQSLTAAQTLLQQQQQAHTLSEQSLQQRISELESQINEKDQLDWVYDVIHDFEEKEQEIEKLFKTIADQCMRLIEVIRDKERFQGSFGDKVAELKASVLADSSVADEAEAKINLFEDLDLIQSEYTSKIHQLSGQILFLNNVINEQNSTAKQSKLQLDEAKDRCQYLQRSSRQLEAIIRSCHQQHEPAIDRLKKQNKFQEAEIQNLTEDITSLEHQINNLMGQLDSLRSAAIANNTTSSLELERLRDEKLHYEKSKTEMMRYIDELRAEQQNAESNLIQLEAELVEAREKLIVVGKADEQIGLEGQISALVELLREVSKGRGQSSTNLELSRILGGDFVHSNTLPYRINKLWVMERLREVSVDFQKLKADRLKALQGNMELRKDFIKSIRPLQNRLDQLLSFGQGLLNCNEGQAVSAAPPFYIKKATVV